MSSFIYYYKANSKLRLIWGKPLHHLNIFRETYEKNRAIGSQAKIAIENVQSSEKEKREMMMMMLMRYKQIIRFIQRAFIPSAPLTPKIQGPLSFTPWLYRISTSKGTKQKTPMISDYYS